MLHAVIMAGGSGTRFWPLSRADRPKQLLNLVGQRTLLQATVDRLGELVPAERTLVLTNRRLVESVAEQLPELPPEAIVGEPCKRDTAPCIGLAAALIARRDPEATMLVMPADHAIGNEQLWRDSVAYAAELVRRQPERIVTFGIPPTYPAETFGYIERGRPLEGAGGPWPTWHVLRFREKPAADVARQYLQSGKFFWNAGIFVWKARTVLQALRRFEPQMHAHLQAISDALDSQQFAEVLQQRFAAIDGKSIDYAVMERYDQVVAVEAPYSWDDVGSWQALARLQGSGPLDNTAVGRYLGLRTEGSIVRTDDNHLIVTVGLKDVIVVHTPDATLVADKHQEESLREVVQRLKQKGWDELL